MAILVMFPPPALRDRLDIAKCIKMALLHDIPEAVMGDLTPAEGVSRTERHRREELSLDFISKRLLGSTEMAAVGTEYHDLCKEFNDAQTLESKYVQDTDKLEMLLQWIEYERRASGVIKMDEFAYAATKLRLPGMQKLGDEVMAQRQQFWMERRTSAETPFEQDSKLRKLQDEYYTDA